MAIAHDDRPADVEDPPPFVALLSVTDASSKETLPPSTSIPPPRAAFPLVMARFRTATKASEFTLNTDPLAFPSSVGSRRTPSS